MKTREYILTICEAAICVALALVLSYIKIDAWGLGGSIDFVMIPIICLAVRRGVAWGVGAGLIFGTLKYFFAAGFALNWQSIIFDYSLAYAAVGLAGAVKGTCLNRFAVGAVIGGLMRFLIHFISGITIYAQWMPEEFLNMTMTNTWMYSALYNGTYMVPNIVIAALVSPAVGAALRQVKLKNS